MKRNTKTTVGLATAIVLGFAFAPAAYAGSHYGNHAGQGAMMAAQAEGMQGAHGGGMQGDMMQMMQKRHQMMGGMMGAQGGGMGYMTGLDTDGDGTVTPEEAKVALQAKLAEFDTNGDGTLSIAEFEALHAAAIREMMVDRFQALDNDGDGQVTAGELSAAAEAMQGMMGGQNGGAGMHAGNAGGMMPNQDNN